MPILVTETTPIAISGISSSMGVFLKSGGHGWLSQSGGQNSWNPRVSQIEELIHL
jgi:hypothetical protein